MNLTSSQLIRDEHDKVLVSYINSKTIFPKTPTVYSTLPSASSVYRGKLAIVYGGAGVHDHLYICLKSASDTYSWVVITDGGA